MRFELNEEKANEVRNLAKSLYESYGQAKSYKDLGNSMIQVDFLLDIYKSYIQFVETVMGEINEDFHKKKKTIDKETLAEWKSKIND